MVFYNRVAVATATTGTGTVTLGDARPRMQTFAGAGVEDESVIRYMIEDGTEWEIGEGTYSSAGPTLSRDVVEESSQGTSKIDLSGSAVVRQIVSAEDLNQMAADLLAASNAILGLATVASTGDYTDLSNRPTLGTAAAADTGDFATAAQGAKADTAVQPGALGNSAALDVGTAAGTVAAGNDSRFHDQVSLVGTPNYLSISGQEITRWPIDLTAHVTGTLPAGNLPNASLTAQGVVELATAAEFIAGTDSTRALVTSEIWNAASYTALTDAATIALNFNSFLTLAQCTLAGNRTLGNPTNERVGQQFILKFTATGATRTLTLHSDFKLAQGVEAGPYSITTSQTLYICGFVDAASNLIVTGVVRL